MKKTLLKLVANTFNKYLRSKLSPAGQATLYHWEAECNLIIDGLDDTMIPITGTETITPPVVVRVFDWFLTQVSTANERSWSVKCLCQMMSLECHRHTTDILSVMKDPPQMVGVEDTDDK